MTCVVTNIFLSWMNTFNYAEIQEKVLILLASFWPNSWREFDYWCQNCIWRFCENGIDYITKRCSVFRAAYTKWRLGILLRFREHRFIVVTDICKMYRKILIHSEDRYYKTECGNLISRSIFWVLNERR